jgi:hypothetical protein
VAAVRDATRFRRRLVGPTSAVLQVESETRWDALALARRLSGYRWYIVEPAARRWEVRVAVDGAPAEILLELRSRISDWLEERRLPLATVRADGVEYTIEPLATSK